MFLSKYFLSIKILCFKNTKHLIKLNIWFLHEFINDISTQIIKNKVFKYIIKNILFENV